MKTDGSTDFFVSQILADYEENNPQETPCIHATTEYSNSELLERLHHSKLFASGLHDVRCTELKKMSLKMNSAQSVSSVYYPFCGADVTHVFLLFPSCTSVVGFGRDEFGDIGNLNYYSNTNDFSAVPLGYTSGFDSHKYHEVQGKKYPDGKYKVCPDILLRITQILGGKILSVATKQVGDSETDIVHEIKFLWNDIERSFIYAQYEVCCNYQLPEESSSVRDFLLSQNPDALLLKAIPDVLLAYPDGLAMAKALVRHESQLVLSDTRTYNWNKTFYQREQPQPVFSDSAELKSIPLFFSFGYGRMLFIGNGAQLKKVQPKKTNHLTEFPVQKMLPIENNMIEKQENAKSELNINIESSLPKSVPNAHKKNDHSSSFSPLKFLRKKLNKQSNPDASAKQINYNPQ
ncbi:hypothetical protein [Legionella jamestowniensis]|uniref:Uncharacterized protein n=1 Tax=Legionella jamestowniensis TaxID=455 RepID=A0A0W0UU22_9GAMM|nr:hypothetical protein [Legionella jamestowniensis]KTD11364.1 hypothetical protein Ljam_0558 [Legionella jamestowniensis]OCH98777.1 hypothetical protein A8135_10775 [Legionella jamestowniensis]SFL68441.1 hypothetical protein SAMN02746073_1355 [Legionella jamestowniensis DSM 19215]